MSFRKRSEIIGGTRIQPTAVDRNPRQLPLRIPNAAVPGRQPINIGVRKQEIAPIAKQDISNNPGVRPSLVTSQPTTSTGTSDLDKILLHQGLPLGTSLLIEESGTTDFASVIIRAFASQGILHNRITENLQSHIIVLGLSSTWSNDLPGIYKGSSKEQKKAKIAEQESKVSVSNLASNDLKIAWRYGLNQKKSEEQNQENSTYEHYNNQFDLTQKLTPGPNKADISYIQLSNSYQSIISQIKSIIKQHSNKVIRLIIPNLLNPSIYPPQLHSANFIIPFIHSLRSLLREYSSLVLISSISLDLYSRDNDVVKIFENLFDGVVILQPFDQEMSQLIEKAYRNEPSKIQQGLVNIVKIPILSEKGLMLVHYGEYAFKNGRKRFEIEEWGIPVEDGDKDTNTTQEGGQTTKNIDF
ncbi:unnamed protein product [Candida verbasci]|uniref:Elongator complex protein 4 n=1 Tax=Candida verbasci TaxID=1227364 RepID=A0A9W4TT91_9ASCO|nr:unnamed protein product [Candida verbasci]